MGVKTIAKWTQKVHHGFVQASESHMASASPRSMVASLFCGDSGIAEAVGSRFPLHYDNRSDNISGTSKFLNIQIPC